MPTREELKILQALPLDVKVAKTKLRIREFVEHYGEDDCYISFSGGKDSTVLLDIVRSIYPNMLAIFADTGLEYPEIKKFVKTFDNVQIVRPAMNFRQVIEKYGYPIISKEVSECVSEGRICLESGGTKYVYRLQSLRGERLDRNGNKSIFNKEKYEPLLYAPFLISNKCCREMKKNPLKQIKKNPIIGIMAQESKLRRQNWLKNGCNMFDGKKPQSNPMSFWTEQDVLRYINEYNLLTCSVYGNLKSKDEQLCFNNIISEFVFDGEQRTGCVFCAFGEHLEKEQSKFERLKETHPKLYNYCINGGEFDKSDGLWKPNDKGLGMGYVFDWCNENINNFEIRYK